MLNSTRQAICLGRNHRTAWPFSVTGFVKTWWVLTRYLKNICCSIAMDTADCEPLPTSSYSPVSNREGSALWQNTLSDWQAADAARRQPILVNSFPGDTGPSPVDGSNAVSRHQNEASIRHLRHAINSPSSVRSTTDPTTITGTEELLPPPITASRGRRPRVSILPSALSFPTNMRRQPVKPFRTTSPEDDELVNIISEQKRGRRRKHNRSRGLERPRRKLPLEVEIRIKAALAVIMGITLLATAAICEDDGSDPYRTKTDGGHRSRVSIIEYQYWADVPHHLRAVHSGSANLLLPRSIADVTAHADTTGTTSTTASGHDQTLSDFETATDRAFGRWLRDTSGTNDGRRR